MASNKKDLKAFVRYDGTGRVIAGSNILQRFKPKVGKWEQIGAYECCDPYCTPPEYEVDYIIQDVVESEAGINFIIQTNPFTLVKLQVCVVSCESDPPGRIIPLQIENIPPGSVPPNSYNYFVPWDVLYQGCALGFRKVCTDNVSGWDLGL